MDLKIYPGKLAGTIDAIPSKSQAHRLLICAAFADGPTRLVCPQISEDIRATARCLRALGAEVTRTETGFSIAPAKSIPERADLDCGESGSTLRFLLPVTGALGVDGTFLLGGRLPERPLSPLWEEMERMGCRLDRPTANALRCQGKLSPGEYTVDGGISSQFVTGLLLALALIPGESRVRVTGQLQSRPYLAMTQKAMDAFGVRTEGLALTGGHRFHSPGELKVEGDWSNAAFFLAANALGSQVEICGLNPDSAQGDRAVEQILPMLEGCPTIPAGDIPDLVPVLAVAAGAKRGAVFTQIRRLRLKESDRVESVLALLHALGGRGEATEDALTVYPCQYQGGVVDSFGDHRIAMAAAIAATVAQGPVTVLGAQCAVKSYPDFWRDFGRLGGRYEQHIRG